MIDAIDWAAAARVVVWTILIGVTLLCVAGVIWTQYQEQKERHAERMLQQQQPAPPLDTTPSIPREPDFLREFHVGASPFEVLTDAGEHHQLRAQREAADSHDDEEQPAERTRYGGIL
jgi:hypothetical protein